MSEADSVKDEIAHLDVSHRELLHQGHLLTFVSETFDYSGDEMRREFVQHPGAVGVIALDEKDRVLTIRQYRHPIRSWSWEAPAGLLDVVDEPLLVAAQRELAEEADLAATDWAVLLDLVSSPGMSNEFVRVFLARGLSATAVYAREGEEADIEVRWVPLDDVVAAAMRGDIRNAILVAGVFAAANARDRGWAGLRTPDAAPLQRR